MEAAITLIIKLTGHVAQAMVHLQLDSISMAEAEMPVDLPGIAYATGIAIWSDVATFKKFLRMFLRNYANVASELRQLDLSATAALAHKIKGAAANLALNDVAARADTLEHVINAGQPPTAAIAGLQAAMAVVLETIRHFAPQELTPEPGDIRLSDVAMVRPLLTALLDSWGSDSTSQIREAMAGLGALLPPGQLAPIQAALDDYDFRAGEALTRALLLSLDSTPEGA